ncbi:uncharacterized protein TNIN_334971 [Trichonephila inaurata madagascariensis]|uniref:Uncharacterized protein n=1 Tax=Trichonephila inaurata madagascariensis TaxID=2747483 RepID=A0A8X7BRX4_9ARAC|nr:uncharacterized protein TNIN_334971 [Trichonephila inaurata madagascariensis]
MDVEEKTPLLKEELVTVFRRPEVSSPVPGTTSGQTNEGRPQKYKDEANPLPAHESEDSLTGDLASAITSYEAFESTTCPYTCCGVYLYAAYIWIKHFLFSFSEYQYLGLRGYGLFKSMPNEPGLALRNLGCRHVCFCVIGASDYFNRVHEIIPSRSLDTWNEKRDKSLRMHFLLLRHPASRLSLFSRKKPRFLRSQLLRQSSLQLQCQHLHREYCYSGLQDSCMHLQKTILRIFLLKCEEKHDWPTHGVYF